MAVVKMTRRGWFGVVHTRASGPSSDGTKAAFKLGEKTFKKSGGAAPGLKQAVAKYKANTAPVTR